MTDWSSPDDRLVTDGSNLIGVEDEAQWLGRMIADGSITLTFSEMQNARPDVSPPIIAYRLNKVS